MRDVLEIISVISLVLAGLSAAVILFDIYVSGHHPKMKVMEAVWPITALYFGPFGLLAYWAFGRSPQEKQRSGEQHKVDGKHQMRKRPFWQSVFVSVCHCGGGCTLGDIAGEWAVFLTGATIAGAVIWATFAVDFVIAYLLGIAFQFFAIAPMRGLGLRDGIVEAAKADTLSLAAFEIGMFGWMALMRLVFFHPALEPNDPAFWFMMQIGMIIGFATSYPMNWFLVSRGIKERM